MIKDILLPYKNLLKEIPTNREYSKVEALICLQCDFKEGGLKSFRYYERLWKWGNRKVKFFIEYYIPNTSVVHQQNPPMVTKKQDDYISGASKIKHKRKAITSIKELCASVVHQQNSPMVTKKQDDYISSASQNEEKLTQHQQKSSIIIKKQDNCITNNTKKETKPTISEFEKEVNIRIEKFNPNIQSKLKKAFEGVMLNMGKENNYGRLEVEGFFNIFEFDMQYEETIEGTLEVYNQKYWGKGDIPLVAKIFHNKRADEREKEKDKKRLSDKALQNSRNKREEVEQFCINLVSGIYLKEPYYKHYMKTNDFVRLNECYQKGLQLLKDNGINASIYDEYDWLEKKNI